MNRSAQSSWLLLASLYFGFTLTGIGTTLLGSALPALSASWGLSDSRAGFLFAAQFAGSSSGALLVQSRLNTSIVRGYLLMTASAVLLAFCGGRIAPVFYFSFGLGLGLAMTATSMTIGRIYNASRGASLSLLNAAWGFGAVVCPLLVSAWVHFYSASWLFAMMAIASAIPLVSLGLAHFPAASISSDPVASSNTQTKISLLLPLGALAFLYVGVESSISGWMMTYIHRLPLSGTALAPAVTSLFWVAILCGRTAAPSALKRMSEPRLLTASLALALVGILLLLLSRGAASSLASAALTGLMLAPVFPLCISKLLELTDKPSQSRWIFAFSGFGGAVLPWITGQIASMRGSLRIGLAVPLVGSAIMLLLHLAMRSATKDS